MGLGDDIKHTAEDIAGKAKETIGKVTNNDKLEAEGKADQAKSDVQNVGQAVKDTLTGDK